MWGDLFEPARSKTPLLLPQQLLKGQRIRQLELDSPLLHLWSCEHERCGFLDGLRALGSLGNIAGIDSVAKCVQRVGPACFAFARQDALAPPKEQNFC